MGKYKEKIRRAAIDFFYEKMTVYQLRKDRVHIRKYYLKWLKVKQDKTDYLFQIPQTLNPIPIQSKLF
ncbi:hypothetical protein [Bernardetia sp.]|uniref:hypothetical protein n=1 Tax=Bernardetia sp. TaxID=1937974 RepID=UPI0025BE526C|nr:hypothetical protein [Bernardetia sp.]